MSEESRRTNARFPLKLKVKITTESFCSRSVMTQDFSDGGLFILDAGLAELAQDSRLTVQVDEGIEDSPLIKARIAWTNSKGAGIEYLLDGDVPTV